MFDGAVHGHQQALRLERLGQEMVGTELRGLDGCIERRIAGEHDDLGVRPLLFDLRKQVEAVGVGQLEIEQDDIGLRAREGLLQRRARIGGGHGKRALQNLLHEVPHIGFVFDDQDRTFHKFCVLSVNEAWINASNIPRCSAC